MNFRCAALLACLLVLASGAAICDNATMGRYSPQQASFTTEKLEPPLALSWEFVGSRFRGNPAAPVVADGVCYFASGDRVYAIDLLTGNLKWKYPQDQSLTSLVKTTPMIEGGMLYFGAVDGKLYCLDAKTGAFQWFFETRGALRCPPIVQDGIMFLGCDDNSIYTIDAATGDTAWSKPFVSRDDFGNGVAVGSGMVVGSSMDGNMYFINASSGKLRQVFRLPNAPVKTSPIMAENITVMAVANTMYGLTTRSGQRKWMIQLPSEAASTPATDGTSVYVACHDKNLYCYNIGGRNPALKWTAPAALSGAPLSSPTVADQIVYVTTAHGIVSGFSVADGTLKWRYVFIPYYANGVSTVDAACSPVVANGALLVLTDDGVLHCFTKTAPDSTPPEIYSISPNNGVRMSGAPPIKFSANVWDTGSGADIGNGDSPGSATMTLDGNVVPLVTDPAKGQVSYTFDIGDEKTAVKPLRDGVHIVALTVKDYAGNQTTREWTFVADSSMPPPKRTVIAKPVGKSTRQPTNQPSNTRGNNPGSTTPGDANSPTPPPPPGGWDTNSDRSREWRDRRERGDRGNWGPAPPN